MQLLFRLNYSTPARKSLWPIFKQKWLAKGEDGDIYETSQKVMSELGALPTYPKFAAINKILGHAELSAAGCLAVFACVAMFMQWRIDGRAQVWWLAIGYVVPGIPALLQAGPVRLAGLLGWLLERAFVLVL